MKLRITTGAVLFFGICNVFAQENTEEKTTSSNNLKSIDCHLKLDDVKGVAKKAKDSKSELDYSNDPQNSEGSSNSFKTVQSSKNSIKTKGVGTNLNRTAKPDGSNDSYPIPVKNAMKKGWDGSVKGIATPAAQEVNDFNSSRSNRERGSLMIENPTDTISIGTKEMPRSKRSEANGNLK